MRLITHRRAHSLHPYKPEGRFEFRLGRSRSVQLKSVNFFCQWFVHDLNVLVQFCKTASFICLFIHNDTMFLVASAVAAWEKSFICLVWCFIKFMKQIKSEKNTEVPDLTQWEMCVYMKSERTAAVSCSVFLFMPWLTCFIYKLVCLFY